MTDRLAAHAPSLDDFERLMRRAFASLPDRVRRACADLALRVEDFPPDDVLDELGIEDPYELTGLYDGIALTERSVMHQPTRPDAVWLYRRPILEEWIDRGDVGARPAGAARPRARDRPPPRLVGRRHPRRRRLDRVRCGVASISMVTRAIC